LTQPLATKLLDKAIENCERSPPGTDQFYPWHLIICLELRHRKKGEKVGKIAAATEEAKDILVKYGANYLIQSGSQLVDEYYPKK